jgi:hypothetical protein
MAELPRYPDTGKLVAGCLAWPVCDECGWRIPPVDDDGAYIDACTCER